MNDQLVVHTTGRGFVEITGQVQAFVAAAHVSSGLCNIFVQHTSASLTIQENADPSARHDLERWLERMVPEGDPAWTHKAEGPDDMPSHVRSMLTDVSMNVPVRNGVLALGTWQGVYLCEHRSRPHARTILLTLTGADA